MTVGPRLRPKGTFKARLPRPPAWERRRPIVCTRSVNMGQISEERPVRLQHHLNHICQPFRHANCARRAVIHIAQPWPFDNATLRVLPETIITSPWGLRRHGTRPSLIRRKVVDARSTRSCHVVGAAARVAQRYLLVDPPCPTIPCQRGALNGRQGFGLASVSRQTRRPRLRTA